MATNRVGFNRLQQAAGHGGGAYTSSKQNHMLAAMYIVYRWILRRRYRSRNKPHLSLRAMSSIYDLPPYDQAVLLCRPSQIQFTKILWQTVAYVSYPGGILWHPNLCCRLRVSTSVAQPSTGSICYAKPVDLHTGSPMTEDEPICSILHFIP